MKECKSFICSLSSAILPVICLYGCATQGVSTHDYIPPSTPKFTAEKHIEKSNNDVWDLIVENIAKSYFSINNIDKESRIINIDFSHDKPNEFMSCGKTVRVYNDGKTNEVVEYGVADKVATFKVATKQQPHPSIRQYYQIVRIVPKITGRVNIYVAPEGKGTKVTVNAKMVALARVQAEVISQHAYGNIVQTDIVPGSESELIAVTKGPYNNPVDDPIVKSIVCYSTGNLEQAILDLAR